MTSPTFSRAGIEKYIASFLQAITENPNFCNPRAGGADEEVINEIFIEGIQTKHFRDTLVRYNTKTILDTFEAVTHEIPIYQRSLDSGMVPLVEKFEKAPPP